MKAKTNHIFMNYTGPNYIQFKDGQKLKLSCPASKLGGMIWGARTISMEGLLQIEDEKNGLKACVFFNREGESFDEVKGKVYRYDPVAKK